MDKTIIAYREYDPIHDLFSAILNFDLEVLERKYNEGFRYYAFYSDSTKSEVKPEEIKRLGEARQETFQFIQPAYVNERTLAIFEILNGIMEPLLEILPEEKSEGEEPAAPQGISLKAGVKAAALTKSDAVSTTYKERVRGALQNLKTLVEMGGEYENNENDEQ